MNKKMKTENLFRYSYIIFIISSIVFLLIGCLLGIFFYKHKEYKKIVGFEKVVAALNSEAIPSIVSYGKVTKIDGRNLQIAFNEDTITIIIRDNAKVYMIKNSLAGKRSISEFGDIKIGDMVNIELSVNEDGEFIGNSVIDFSEK